MNHDSNHLDSIDIHETDIAATPFIGDSDGPLSYTNQPHASDEDTPYNLQLYLPESEQHDKNTFGMRSLAKTDAQSLLSLDTHALPPTSPEENSWLTKQYLSQVMSVMYAIILVTFGLVFYALESTGQATASLIFSMILCCVGFLYLLILMIDISRYKSSALKNRRIKEIHEEGNGLQNPMTPEEDTPFGPSVPRPAFVPLKHWYCFSQGRHAGSFYLKMGAVLFAIGHLVHLGLWITLQVAFLLDDDFTNNECIDYLPTVLDCMVALHCMLQLYFIFMYSNVIILRAQNLARFAFMHMLGSSLCFWLMGIVRESTLTLTIYAFNKYDNSTTDSKASGESRSIFDLEGLYNTTCSGSKAADIIVGVLSPYLYPFSVEFNILIVAVYYIIWSNIGNCENSRMETNSTHGDIFPCSVHATNEDDDRNSNIVIHADCSASSRGLFAGLGLLVIVIGTVIIGFVFGNVGGNFFEVGYMLSDILKLGIHSAMLVSSALAFRQLQTLDINRHTMSLLDDVLLFICLPAFFLETLLTLIATIHIVNVTKSIGVIVMAVQVVIQTPLIMDGLRRCSNSKKLRRSKPGRELLMFLLIANVSMWLFNTFSYKSPESLDERYEYYGKVLWTILGHISLPLIMFYRFHSSVCFADIWDSAYKPGSEH